MGYFGYYFAFVLLSYLVRQPWLLAGVVVLWLLRGFIPRPGALLGALGRAGRLRRQVSLNRANITARRDLATIYLDLLRPGRALGLLEEGLALAPDDPELLYLSGVALHRTGKHQAAVDRLVRAVEKDARLRHGHPYLVAGDALLALGRCDDAIDAYERFLDFNSSDVQGHTQLARAYSAAKDRQAARKFLLAGLAGWHGLPGAMKRRQFGAYLRGHWARITVVKDVSAMLVALAGVVLSALVARALYPSIAGLWAPDPWQQDERRLARSLRLCGSQRTGDFAGAYEATHDSGSHFGLQLADDEQPELVEFAKELYASFEIKSDRIVSGQKMVQEFCLTRVLERTPTELHAEAVLHPDRDDASDAWLVEIHLVRGVEATRFSYAPLGRPLDGELVTLRRRPVTPPVSP